MGQIFHACAYDVETKISCVLDADKFHANCFSCSGTVACMHYLLHQKPYRIMWGGAYMLIDHNLEKISKDEILLGISTFWDLSGIAIEEDDIKSKNYCQKIQYIEKTSKSWKNINNWKQASEFFDWENTCSVKYSGYLLNHTKKQAIDLEEYHNRSKYIKDTYEIAIDPLPVLTETGGGTQMALYNGVSIDSTEELAGLWCSDLLQIVDEIPHDYQLINCCFAEIWSRAKYCYRKFGVNQLNFLLNDNNGKLFESASLNLYGKRMQTNFIKVEKNDDNKIRFYEYEKSCSNIDKIIVEQDQALADNKKTITDSKKTIAELERIITELKG